ncbi:SLAM family member 7 isoform X2 [Fundulus heteroclitus]|uniref:SLAM family member 7 isoform X2 n=1 Tax=Fundulus heteroclitus TaxID=8078 RepID=UPI00165B7EC9|nr:SLAM family member 7 isoform X2 [Fundulus heteroclitus]
MFQREQKTKWYTLDKGKQQHFRPEYKAIDASTAVLVKTGGDVFLNVSEADVPKDFHIFLWKFVTEDVLVSFFSNGESKVHGVYAGRIDFSEKKHSIKLKNLQKSDSGLYTAVVIAASEQTLNEYNVTIQDPVSPVDLVVDSVSSASSSCNLTVTCITEDSNISSTFRCTTKTCYQEGGEKSKATKSGASLHVCLSNLSIICNHSNRVSWSEKKTATDPLCLPHADAEELSGVSICGVKKVVVSVGLIIMVLAVIGVHLTEKFKKYK